MAKPIHPRIKSADYSPDMELDENGVLRWTRDIEAGEMVSIPAHLLKHLPVKPKRREVK